MNSALEIAVKTADEIFRSFIRDVVNQHIVNVRVGQLSSHTEKNVTENINIDDRIVHLLAISGKGNVDNPDYENVTLLDHLLSVARGAMLLAVMDDVTELEKEDISVLQQQLALVAVTAFLHDLDKDEQLARNEVLTIEMVTDRMEKYGLNAWLAKYQVALTSAQMLCLRAMAESSERYRYLPDVNLPREANWAIHYVEVADKLDGIWLHKDGGIEGVLTHLNKTQKLRNPLTRRWRTPPIDIFDPHHPFLLDELQRALSKECSNRLGIPPLIEVHKDGRLLMLLPEGGEKTDAMIEAGLQRFAKRLPGGLSLHIDPKSSKGVPALNGGQPSFQELKAFLRRLDDTELVKLFYIKKATKPLVEQNLGTLLYNTGLLLKWSEGNLCLPFTDLKDILPDAKNRLQHAAIAALLLNLGDKPKNTRKQRAQAFVNIFGEAYPAWLSEISDAQSQRSLTALWAAFTYAKESTIFETIWGDTGLLSQWWENEPSGLRLTLDDQGDNRLAAVLTHYRALLNNQRVVADNENALGHCLFTDRPVDFVDTISTRDKLYEVKISAFSGRDGRPEMLDSAQGYSHLGPVTRLEYQLRQINHKLSEEKRPEGLPTLISFPTTAGLFGGFALDDQQEIQDLSLYKLATKEIKKGAVRFNLNHYAQRVRVARFQRLKEATIEQVNQLRLLLKAAQRLGRPLHIFRGLPTPQRAFFYFDAMPSFLIDLLGNNALRLEQIPDALDRLEIANHLLNASMLGLEVLRAFASPNGRLGALCLAWCHLLDRNESHKTRTFLMNRIHHLLKENNMTTKDRAFVRFGQKVAEIQQRFGEGASNSEQLRVFNKAFEAVTTAKKYGQDDMESLIYAVAGELEKDLGENRYAAIRKWRDDKPLLEGCLEAANLFVKEVWSEVLRNHMPPQRDKAVLASIYRVALLDTFRARGKQSSE